MNKYISNNHRYISNNYRLYILEVKRAIKIYFYILISLYNMNG